MDGVGAVRLVLVSSTLAAINLAASYAPVQRPGELVIAPTRVLLDGKTRAAELVLVNRGPSAATYRLSLIDMRMTEDGRLERVPQNGTQPSELSAKSLVRFAPRQVTLGPGESQRVRVGVQRPPNLAAGEYRSHLLFEAVPNALAPAHTDNPDSLSLRFNIVGAVSLPIVVRHGSLSATAQLVQPKVQADALTVRLQRTGERSIRGDVNVFYIADGSTQRQRVGILRELPLYAPNRERSVRIPLSKPGGGSLRRGKLLVTFEEPAAVAGRARATTELALSD